MEHDSQVSSGFERLGLEPSLAQAALEAGLVEPTPLQRDMIGPMLQARDLLVEAASGTGKTAAYLLPILQNIAAEPGTQALLLGPTEAAVGRIFRAVRRIGRYWPVRSWLIRDEPTGQGPAEPAQILLGSLACVAGRLEAGLLELGAVRFVVCDDADEVLQARMEPQLQQIISRVSPDRQLVLCAKAVGSALRQLAIRLLRGPMELAAEPIDRSGRAARHEYVPVQRAQKFAVLQRLLGRCWPGLTVIYANRVAVLERLVRQLQQAGVAAAHLTRRARPGQSSGGDLSLKRADVLVAGPLPPPGVRLGPVTRVVHYELPDDPKAYGARVRAAAASGNLRQVVSLLCQEELGKLERIELRFGRRIVRRDLDEQAANSPADSTGQGHARKAISRFLQPVFGPIEPGGPSGRLPEKTLGSKFRPARRRRRR